MRRTQLYLDDQLWVALHARADIEKTTISELVRQAVRERYLGSQEKRMSVMKSFVGSRKPPFAVSDSTDEVRQMRRGTRLDRFSKL